MNQKIILTSIIILFILSSIFLSYSEKKQHTLENQWIIYFQSPKSESLDFVIENHTNKRNFTWKLICNDRVTEGSSIKINDGEKKGVPIYADTLQSLNCSKKTIEVSSENEKKTIYKFTNL